MRSHSHQSGNYPERSASQTSSTTTSSHSTQRSDEKKHRRFSNPIASKLFRSGSKSPTEIDIPKRKHNHSHSLDIHYIPRSNPQMDYFDQRDGSISPVPMSPEPSSPRSSKPDFPKRASTPTRKNSDNYRRYSGTVYHYGRHSNDWLFGGFSVRDTVRDGIEKLRNHDKDS
ncbi:hypothetical protein N7486_006366 [Penicillium sp. IBT 16267x]|nr:hypothetical protein N7486_006366 [Penicillium sp. IBT 16267x]